MRVVVDTNVLFSTLFHPSPKLTKMMEYLFIECDTLIPSHVADELRSKAILKHPERAHIAEEFLGLLGGMLVASDYEFSTDHIISDPKDQPILNDAIRFDVDIIISGDKHFNKLVIDRPRIMRPAEFIAEFLPNLA